MNSVELYLFTIVPPCRIDGCTRTITNKRESLCDRHYKRLWRHGDPLAGGPLRENATPARAVEDFSDGTRVCHGCEHQLPLTDFHVDNNGTAGRRAKCKDCHSAQARAWYAANRDTQVGRRLSRRHANIEQHRLWDTERYFRDRTKRIELAVEQGHKRRLRLRSAAHDPGVTRANLRKQYGDACFYCAVVMDFGRYKRGETPRDLASIEHVVPISRGGTHTWDNVVLACLSCNLRKNATPLEEWQAA